MKFKKDGLYFSDIIQARNLICGYRDADRKPYCSICPAVYPEHCKLAQYYMQKHLNIDDCYDFCVNNTRIAAEIMGFDVINDDTPTKAKNPLADIGSMTFAQAKEYCREHCLRIVGTEEKCADRCELAKRNICGYGNSYDVYQWELDLISPHELEICKALGAKWVSRDEIGGSVHLWKSMPKQAQLTPIKQYFGDGHLSISTVSADIFQSVKPGDCINVEELLNE